MEPGHGDVPVISKAKNVFFSFFFFWRKEGRTGGRTEGKERKEEKALSVVHGDRHALAPLPTWPVATGHPPPGAVVVPGAVAQGGVPVPKRPDLLRPCWWCSSPSPPAHLPKGGVAPGVVAKAPYPRPGAVAQGDVPLPPPPTPRVPLPEKHEPSRPSGVVLSQEGGQPVSETRWERP
jgi:hypothetical protein